MLTFPSIGIKYNTLQGQYCTSKSSDGLFPIFLVDSKQGALFSARSILPLSLAGWLTQPPNALLRETWAPPTLSLHAFKAFFSLEGSIWLL